MHVGFIRSVAEISTPKRSTSSSAVEDGLHDRVVPSRALRLVLPDGLRDQVILAVEVVVQDAGGQVRPSGDVAQAGVCEPVFRDGRQGGVCELSPASFELVRAGPLGPLAEVLMTSPFAWFGR